VCRLETTTLTPEPASVGEARRWVSDLLARWDLAALVDDLRLVVSELVSNAFLHARTAVDVVLSVGEGVVELAVHDHNARTPRPRVADRGLDAAGGRGLLLVQELSDSWGVSERMDGKDVWFRIAAPQGWRYSSRCVCPAPPASTDERRTPSGARVILMDPRELPGAS
jgi:anti-sigma regulatory factor (Ser/Thr protein kinase)